MADAPNPKSQMPGKGPKSQSLNLEFEELKFLWVLKLGICDFDSAALAHHADGDSLSLCRVVSL